MEILKSDPTTHEIVACVYCSNGEKDSQGDFLEDRNVLEAAEKSFLENPVFNIDHDSGQQLEGLEILESYISDTPEKIGAKVIPENCWIIKISIPPAIYSDLE